MITVIADRNKTDSAKKKTLDVWLYISIEAILMAATGKE